MMRGVGDSMSMRLSMRSIIEIWIRIVMEVVLEALVVLHSRRNGHGRGCKYFWLFGVGEDFG